MTRRPVDLAAHLNETVVRGHPADFRVALRPLHYSTDASLEDVPRRKAVVREDTGAILSIVSDRYTLVPHQRILDVIEEAIRPLDVGPAPRGIYVDRGGARMRAIFKFPDLARPVLRGDDICPCLKIQNTYDGTTRIAVHIGAFRFVCTNLAVGGGGVFGGGFMAVHAGDTAIEKVAEQLASYLSEFDDIVELYRSWVEKTLEPEVFIEILSGFPKRLSGAIVTEFAGRLTVTAYEAYNAATLYATHEMRSYRTAFYLLDRINRTFQKKFPATQDSKPAQRDEESRLAVTA